MKFGRLSFSFSKLLQTMNLFEPDNSITESDMISVISYEITSYLVHVYLLCYSNAFIVFLCLFLLEIKVSEINLFSRIMEVGGLSMQLAVCSKLLRIKLLQQNSNW